MQTDRTSEWEGKRESGWKQQGEVGGGGIYPSCVILAEVFISAAIFCSLTFDSGTTPIPPRGEMKLRKKRREVEREGEAWLMAVSMGALFLHPSPLEGCFWGRAAFRGSRDLAPFPPAGREVEGGRREGEQQRRGLSILQDAQRFVSPPLESHTDPPPHRLPLLLRVMCSHRPDGSS